MTSKKQISPYKINYSKLDPDMLTKIIKYSDLEYIDMFKKNGADFSKLDERMLESLIRTPHYPTYPENTAYQLKKAGANFNQLSGETLSSIIKNSVIKN